MSQQMELFSAQLPASVIQDALGINGLLYRPSLLSSEAQERILSAIDSQPWRSDLRRRVQHYGYRYDYKSRSVDHSMYLGELPQFAIEVAYKLLDESLILQMPDQAIVNEYLPGQGISAHVDCEPCFNDTITTVSFAWAYEMEFSRVGMVHETEQLLLEPGSALVMRGDARYKWRHQIKARRSNRGVQRKRRVSLTFRNVILDRCETVAGDWTNDASKSGLSPIGWLSRRSSGFGRLADKEREAIADFTLLWSYFEAKVFRAGANATAIQRLSKELEGKGRIKAETFGDYLQYFRNRYVANNQFTHHFAGLHFRRSDNQQLVEAVLKGERQGTADTLAALLTIVWRFRNNLFHGLKWSDELQGQLDNFTKANALLMYLIEANER